MESGKWKKLAEFQHKQPVVDVEFSPDGRYALTGSWDNTAVLWALPDGK